jgi:V/A-type H+-transporting ATPase subunit I
MCYFSVFFAMLVGDGGYGSVIFALTMLGWFKAGKNEAVRPWLVLMTVFSLATLAWGFLSNTWFGASLPFASDWASVKWLSDPSYKNMMFLCFTIGASHLIVARLWSAVCILNDRRCLSEFGWAGILFFMYWVTNTIVGIFSAVPSWLYAVFASSLVLVFGFTLKGNELKSRGIELGMLPLNIMSALGDIISYVRLFAVGLASVKVAENFNSMATGLVAGADEIWLKALMSVAMVAILVIGHALNLAMAGLSILVHAVRLNTLEFSNHKGVTWSGVLYNPFKRKKV